MLCEPAGCPSVTASDACQGIIAVVFNQTETAPGSSCNNTITRTWMATDACGNVSRYSQTITVNDTTVPTVVSRPVDATIECPASPAFGTPVFPTTATRS